MPDDRSPVPASKLPSPMAIGLTRAEFDALARELRALRDRVELPDGRSREVHVVGVTPPAGVVEAVTARPGAEAA